MLHVIPVGQAVIPQEDVFPLDVEIRFACNFINDPRDLEELVNAKRVMAAENQPLDVAALSDRK